MAAEQAGLRGDGAERRFTGWEWFSGFRLDYRSGDPGLYHGVIRAWTTPDRPAMLDDADTHDFPPLHVLPMREPDPDAERLRELVHTYENTKYLRLVRWLHPHRQRLRQFLKGKS